MGQSRSSCVKVSSCPIHVHNIQTKQISGLIIIRNPVICSMMTYKGCIHFCGSITFSQDMDSSGGQTQTPQNPRELPLLTGTEDSRVGPGINQGASSDGGDGRVVGGGGCAEGTGGEEEGGREKNESSPPGGGPTESDVAHISSILSRLPAIDTAAAADGNTTLLESEIDQ